MKKIIVATSVLASSVAFAGNYTTNLDGRYDFVNAKNETANGVTEKYNTFSNGTIRLNMFSQVNDSLALRFRFRFQKGAISTIAGAPREDTSTQLDYMYADYKNQYFTTRFGKQNWLEAVGRESFISATDLYASSQAYADYKTAFGSDYRGGVSFIYKYAEGTFTLALSNPNVTASADTTGNTRTNNGLAWGAHYTGTFANKLVQPVLSYQSASLDADDDTATKTKKGSNTMMALGLRSEVAGFVIDADYKELKVANRNDTGTTSLVETKTKSIVANVAYAIGEFTPMVTYINDKFSSETTTAPFKKSTFQLGASWKPMTDTNFNYHLLYASSKKEADGSASTVATVKDTRITFGIKCDI